MVQLRVRLADPVPKIDPNDIHREDEEDDGIEVVPSGRPINKTYQLNPMRVKLAHMKMKMAALYSEGEQYREIAEQLNEEFALTGTDKALNEHAIHYHMKRQLQAWREKALASIDERQAGVLARLAQLEMIATNAYFHSTEGKRTTHYSKQIERAKSNDRKKQHIDKAKQDRADSMTEFGPDPPLMIEQYNMEDIKSALEYTAEKIKNMERLEENAPGDPKWVNILVSIAKEYAKILGLYNRPPEPDEDSKAAKLSDEQREERISTIMASAKERRAEALAKLAPPSPLGGPEEETPDPEPEEDMEWGFEETDSSPKEGIEWD